MSFEKGLKKLLEHEGYYSNVESDHGGETYAGISRHFFPKWEGWRLLDSENYQNAELSEAVANFYRVYFWYPLKCDLIDNDFIAIVVFNFGVNFGKRQAAKKVQRILGVKQDGLIGTKTLYALNETNAEMFIYHFLLEAVEFYSHLAKDFSQRQFFRGWIGRVVDLYHDYEHII